MQAPKSMSDTLNWLDLLQERIQDNHACYFNRVLSKLLIYDANLQTPGLNIITEYVMGIILPGRPIANVCFKVYGYMSMSQAVSFLSDFKLGHYMKIPPRSMFLVQVYSLYHFCRKVGKYSSDELGASRTKISNNNLLGIETTSPSWRSFFMSLRHPE